MTGRFSKLLALLPLAFGPTCWSAAPEVVPPSCLSPAPLDGKWYDETPGYIVLLVDAEENASVTAARLAEKYGFAVENTMRRLRMFAVARFDAAALARLRCDPSVKLIAFNEPTRIATASEDWSLRPTGAGPLRIGMSSSEVSTVLGERRDGYWPGRAVEVDTALKATIEEVFENAKRVILTVPEGAYRIEYDKQFGFPAVIDVDRPDWEDEQWRLIVDGFKPLE